MKARHNSDSQGDSSLVILDDVIYFGSYDGYSYALNASDGRVKWKYRASCSVTTSQLLGSDGSIYFGANDGRPGAHHVYALNHLDGSRWL